MTEQSAHERELLEKSLVDLSVESWRITRTFLRAINSLDANDQARYASQIRFFVRKIEQALDGHGLKIVSFDGSAFEPGLPIVPINQDEFTGGEALIVEQTLEPAIIGRQGLLRMGSVVLGRTPQ